MSIELGQTLIVGQPTVLFEGEYEYGGPGFWFDYDVAPDGQSFLMTRRTTEPPRDIRVVLNWWEELKGRVPVG